MWRVFVIANKLLVCNDLLPSCVITHMHNVKLSVIIEQPMQSVLFYIHLHRNSNTSQYRVCCCIYIRMTAIHPNTVCIRMGVIHTNA